MKVTIELDQTFCWYFSESSPPKLQIDDALAAEFTEAANRYNAVRDKIEQLYRVQEGFKPWESLEVPPHVLLESKC